jgi:hypothetical protein
MQASESDLLASVTSADAGCGKTYNMDEVCRKKSFEEAIYFGRGTGDRGQELVKGLVIGKMRGGFSKRGMGGGTDGSYGDAFIFRIFRIMMLFVFPGRRCTSPWAFLLRRVAAEEEELKFKI